MDTLQLLITPPYWPFGMSLVFLIGIGILEAIGVGFSAIDLDLDADVDHDGPGLLSWLGIGHVPLLAVLVSLSSLFSITGIALQSVATMAFGGPLIWWVAVLIALPISLGLTGVTAGLLARFLPGEETTVIETDSLLGKRATIILGTALPGQPTKAMFRDHHGQSHYILVEPDHGTFEEGEELILVRREGHVFHGTSPYLSNSDI